MPRVNNATCYFSWILIGGKTIRRTSLFLVPFYTGRNLYVYSSVVHVQRQTELYTGKDDHLLSFPVLHAGKEMEFIAS
jgi:hypothetical protein